MENRLQLEPGDLSSNLLILGRPILICSNNYILNVIFRLGDLQKSSQIYHHRIGAVQYQTCANRNCVVFSIKTWKLQKGKTPPTFLYHIVFLITYDIEEQSSLYWPYLDYSLTMFNLRFAFSLASLELIDKYRGITSHV